MCLCKQGKSAEFYKINFTNKKDIQSRKTYIPYSGPEGKVIPVQASASPEDSSRLRFPEFIDSRHMKVVRLSALRTGHL
jgi:hypothetical protein